MTFQLVRPSLAHSLQELSRRAYRSLPPGEGYQTEGRMLGYWLRANRWTCKANYQGNPGLKLDTGISGSPAILRSNARHRPVTPFDI